MTWGHTVGRVTDAATALGQTVAVGVRRIIGIAGCPGAGKSTLAAGLVAEHPDSHVLVPMDGFHLADEQLRHLGRSGRKGAPDTFDVAGYVTLLERLRIVTDEPVYAPRFDRRIEAAIAGAIAVEPRHTTIITEGNYLMHDADGWERVRPLLDECWYVDCRYPARIVRLIARHIEHGRSGAEAAAWVREVDEPNARLIRTKMGTADVIIRSEDGRLALPLPPDWRTPWW
jgi:pantothenate kinase